MGKSNGSGQKSAKVFSTDRMTLLKQQDLLRSWSVSSDYGAQPTTKDQVAKVAALAPYTAGLTDAFFKDVGFIAKTDSGAFFVADEVHDFARAFEFDPDTAAQKLAPKLSQSWFGRCLTARLRIRSLTTDEAIAALADEAKVGADYRGQLQMLLDWLRESGVISVSDGQVRNGPASASTMPVPGPSPDQASRKTASKTSAPAEAPVVTGSQNAVSISYTIEASMEDIGKWPADRIAAFFTGLAQVIAAQKGDS